MSIFHRKSDCFPSASGTQGCSDTTIKIPGVRVPYLEIMGVSGCRSTVVPCEDRGGREFTSSAAVRLVGVRGSVLL